MFSNNEKIAMTVRHHDLPRKVALRDSKISQKLIQAWDVHQDKDKVFMIFCGNYHLLSSQRYWEILRTVWIICGGLGNVHVFEKFMKSTKKNRYCFSTPEEHKKLRELPEKFKVYRACNEENDGGISWSLDRQYTEQYQKIFNKNMVLEKEVSKDEVFAFIDRNMESEILILNK